VEKGDALKGNADGEHHGIDRAFYKTSKMRAGSYGRHCLTTFIRTNDKNMLEMKQLCLHYNTNMYYNVANYENIW